MKQPQIDRPEMAGGDGVEMGLTPRGARNEAHPPYPAPRRYLSAAPWRYLSGAPWRYLSGAPRRAHPGSQPVSPPGSQPVFGRSAPRPPCTALVIASRCAQPHRALSLTINGTLAVAHCCLRCVAPLGRGSEGVVSSLPKRASASAAFPRWGLVGASSFSRCLAGSFPLSLSLAGPCSCPCSSPSNLTIHPTCCML